MSRQENRNEQKKAKERAIKKMKTWTGENDTTKLKKLYENFERTLGHTANTRTLCSCDICKYKRNGEREKLINKSKEKDDE